MPMTARRSYTGPECPRCGGYLDLDLLPAGEHRCLRCGDLFLATPFKAPEVRVRVGSVAEAGPEGAVPCALHAGNAAVGNCTRCGVFMCALCRIEIDGQELCPACFDRLTSEGVLASARTRIRDFRGMALTLGVLGLGTAAVFGVLSGPIIFYFVAQAFRQRRLWNETGGVASLVVAILLGLAHIAAGLLFVIGLFIEASS